MDKCDIVKQVQLKTLEKHIVCVLCGGYFIDATTITECLHSFCRVCIVQYLETSRYCPVCDIQVHKTQPTDALMPDHVLQLLVYKLVPGLLIRELRHRSVFGTGKEVKIEAKPAVSTQCESISVALHYSPDGQALSHNEQAKSAEVYNTRSQSGEPKQVHSLKSRYLLCQPDLTIAHLKKLLTSKLSLPDQWKVEIFTAKMSMSDHFRLLDVAYFTRWRGKGPLMLYYSVYKTKIAASVRATKRVSYSLPQDSSMCPAVSLPSSSSSTSLHSHVDTLNAEFYVRQHTIDTDINNNDIGDDTEKNTHDQYIKTAAKVRAKSGKKRKRKGSTKSKKCKKLKPNICADHHALMEQPLRESNTVTNQAQDEKIGKRKRGRPRKYPLAQTAKKADDTRCNFTFQNTFLKRAKAKQLTIPVSLPKTLLRGLDLGKALSLKEKVEILSSSWKPATSIKKSRCYPRTSTPNDENQSANSSSPDIEKMSRSSTSAEDSGYEASFAPKAFSLLRFNSDEETD